MISFGFGLGNLSVVLGEDKTERMNLELQADMMRSADKKWNESQKDKLHPRSN